MIIISKCCIEQLTETDRGGGKGDKSHCTQPQLGGERDDATCETTRRVIKRDDQ